MDKTGILETVRRIRWTAQASNQLDAIHDYVAGDNVTAAMSQIAAIVRAVKMTSEFPETGRLGRVSSTREVVVRHTPYIVAYRIHASEIEILGIYHGTQQWPQYL